MKRVRNRQASPKQRQAPPEKARPQPPKRRRTLKRKPLLVLLAGSVIMNFILLILLLLPSEKGTLNETVATVGSEKIDRNTWMNAMEREIGRETLQRLINEQVMEAAAKSYKLKVTEEEVDLELALLTASDRQLTIGNHEQSLREQIRANLILEKVLTHDIVIEDDEIQAYYDEHRSLYNVPTSYRTYVIVTDTEEEAKQTIEEVKDGSNFELLAKERSIDIQSSNLGGDLGYINTSTELMDDKILKAAKDLEKGQLSDPIRLEDGTYAVIRVNDVIEEKNFEFDAVKEQIKRVLAMEQLPLNVRPEVFWKEFKVDWIYQEKK